jgi:hypothetical protein
MDLELQEATESKHEEKRINNTWSSCCFNSDRRAVVYFSQLGISLITISFCIYQLTHLNSCEAQSLYSGILTVIVGTWLPQPQLHG